MQKENESPKTQTPKIEKNSNPKYPSLVKSTTNSNWTDFFKNPHKRPYSSPPMSPLTPVTPMTPNTIIADNEILCILNDEFEGNYMTEETSITYGNFPLEKCSAPPLDPSDWE